MQRSVTLSPVWMLIAVAALLLGTTAVWGAYSIFTIEGDVTVLEGITVDGPLAYSVTLYPNEVDDRVFTLRNAGSEPIDVELHKTINPAGKSLHLEISDEDITVPGNGSAQFHIVVSADNDVVPGEYFIEVEITRGGG